MTQTTDWDDVAESYRALYGDPDVTIPYPLAADVRIAVVESEITGMVKVIAAQERTIQRLQKELHVVTAQVVMMADKMQAWEADS